MKISHKPNYAASLIIWFNEALETTAMAEGCTVIDLHGLTTDTHGTADGRLHIDGYHLVPTALGMAKLNQA